jgi:hypothetical protein
MTAHTVPRRRTSRRSRGVFTLPFTLFVGAVAAAAAFVSYALWPSWRANPVALDAPAIPVTVAGVLFDIPPAAIRAAVQRHPGPHERIDLDFIWPSLTPPPPDDKANAKPLDKENIAAEAAQREEERLFVTITGLGTTLPPGERLRSIYPRYIEAKANTGPDGLAILPFRAGTPYDGEDLVYPGNDPEAFFARCTRPARTVPGTCIHERAIGASSVTLRFPRDWLADWRNVAARFDRLIAQLHPEK